MITTSSDYFLMLNSINNRFIQYFDSRIIAFTLQATNNYHDLHKLAHEQILGIGLARKPWNKTTISQVAIIRERTGNERLEEIDLLIKLNGVLNAWQPQLLVGYGCKSRDILLLAQKQQYYRTHYFMPLPAICTLLEKTQIIDLQCFLPVFMERFKLSNIPKSPNNTINHYLSHPAFSNIPFRLNKDDEYLFSSESNIMDFLWDKLGRKFDNYLKCSATNLILLTFFMKQWLQ